MIKAEVGHKVVLWVSLWCLECSIELMIKKFLGICSVVKGCLSLDVLTTEVGDEVINLPGWFIPGVSLDIFVPWNTTLIWSELQLRSLDL